MRRSTLKRRGFVTPFAAPKRAAVAEDDGAATSTTPTPARTAAPQPPPPPGDGFDIDLDLDDSPEPARPNAPPPATATTTTSSNPLGGVAGTGGIRKGLPRRGLLGPKRVMVRPSAASAATATPAQPVAGGGGVEGSEGEVCYDVFYTKSSTKKRKQWASGVLLCGPQKVRLRDEEGAIAATAFKVRKPLSEGDELSVGGYDVQVLSALASPDPPPPPQPPQRVPPRAPPAQQQAPTRTAGGSTGGGSADCDTPSPSPAAQGVPGGGGPPVRYSVTFAKNTPKKHKSWDAGEALVGEREMQLFNEDGKQIARAYKLFRAWGEGEEFDIGAYIISFEAPLPAQAAPGGGGGAPPPEAAAVVLPSHKRTQLGRRGGGLRGNRGGRYFLLSAFTEEDCLPLAKDAEGNVTAYLDKVLTRKLRDHQREGVRFLYDRTSRPDGEYRGVILADEMGLGKTLQCIALIEAHLKNKLSGVKKVVVVTPSSLVANWGREFKKWLPNASYLTQPVVVSPADKKGQTASKLRTFSSSNVCPILIISYEMLRSNASHLSVKCDLLICDEGHRLKGASTQISQCLLNLRADCKVLITGTPVQNDLTEYFSLFDFINPGMLGDRAAFRRKYVGTAQPSSSDTTPSSGESPSDASCGASELRSVTSGFILRRTQASITSTLPKKTEILLFCKPSPLQEVVCRTLLDAVGSQSVDPLKAIHLLKKCLIDPAIAREGLAGIADITALQRKHPHGGQGKLAVVSGLLSQFRKQGLKCVVISSSVQALNVIQEEITARRLGPTARLDGSIPSAKRMEAVDVFNKASSGVDTMLLSCKAGGVGLNLIGANRAILVDMDWNPANDLQAVARIWREGQTRECRIYRLVTRGTLEERILQRQLVKMHLSNRMAATGQDAVEVMSKPSRWTLADAKRLFEYNDALPCVTFCTAPAADGGAELQHQIDTICSPHDPAVTPSLVTYVAEIKTDDIISCGDKADPKAKKSVGAEEEGKGGGGGGESGAEDDDLSSVSECLSDSGSDFVVPDEEEEEDEEGDGEGGGGEPAEGQKSGLKT